jgi:hypothetical protein
MSGRWFRLYDELLNDPKVQKLPPWAFKMLINLWCIASKNEGVISEEGLPYALRMRSDHVSDGLLMLFSCGLLERIEPSSTNPKVVVHPSFTPHNWALRNPNHKTSTERTRAYRARERSREQPGTPLEVEVDIEVEVEVDKKVKASGDALPVKEAFELFNLKASSLGIPQAKVLTPGRATKLRARLEEHGLDGWKEALAAIERQPFLLGRNDRAWRVNLDFLLQTASLNKVREGAYSDEGRAETVQETAARLVQESEEKNGAVLDWMQTLDSGGSIEIRANPGERLPALPAPRGLRGVSADDG